MQPTYLLPIARGSYAGTCKETRVDAHTHPHIYNTQDLCHLNQLSFGQIGYSFLDNYTNCIQ